VAVNLTPLLPGAEVLVAALVVLLLDLFTRKEEKAVLVWTSLASLVIAGAMALYFRAAKKARSRAACCSTRSRFSLRWCF
jgi:NADH:ubiquinone oxidoreductase subunit 2 (subunit N)